MSNQLYNGGRSGRTQNSPTMKSTAKVAGSHAKVDKLTKGDTYDRPKGKR